jgi:Na+/phosphate symporter
MNDEERQRQMDFILNQQAQFAADIQRLNEAQARTEETLNRTNVTLDRAVGALNQLTAVTLNLAETMVNGFQELREKAAASEARHAELIAEMDERLNRMIVVVERHISEGPHGTSQQGS